MTLKFTEKLKLETHNAIVMITGLKQTGRELFAEMEMTKEQMQRLERDFASGKEIILKNYGKVLNCDWVN